MDGRKRSREVTEQMEALVDLSLANSGDATSSAQQQEPKAESSSLAEVPRKRRQLAVWRKVDEQIDWDNTKKRSCRVIDAILEEQDGDPNSTSIRKRRRLTLLDTDAAFLNQTAASKPKKNHTGYRIFNPIERMVDDSLKQVAAGSLSAAQHLNFCCNDPNLASSAQKWLMWCNIETGNLLHGCAMWNDVETTNSLLSRTLKREQVEALIDAVDAEGRTPYEVAQLSGSTQICEVLEAYGGDQRNSLLSNGSFVYDMYYLDESCSHQTTNSQDGSDSDNQAVTCELEGGVGYWKESGELVLEIPKDREDLLLEIENGDYDEDSNSENWEGNDYPEDEYGGKVCFDDDDDDDDDDDEVDVSFRHRSVNMPRSAFNFEDDDFAHDASYGIYGQETEYDDEC